MELKSIVYGECRYPSLLVNAKVVRKRRLHINVSVGRCVIEIFTRKSGGSRVGGVIMVHKGGEHGSLHTARPRVVQST